MRYLTRTIIVFVVLGLTTPNPAFAQDAAGEKVPTFTISGSVGLGGVQMRGLPGEPVTGNDGTYSVKVKTDWLGAVTPTKEGYMFNPPQRQYMTPIKDLTNQDYAPAIITYIISGQVGIPSALFQGHAPVLPDVVMQGLPSNPVTDENGYYTCTVDYGWAGTVMPVKEGYIFDPPRLSYTKVMRDQKNQNYTAEQLTQTQRQYGERGLDSMQPGIDRRGSRRVIRTTGFQPADSRRVLVVPAAEVNPKDLAEIIEDMQIMSHILDERFKEARRVQGVFTDFGDFFGRDNRATEATYLQGYGVLFSMEVNFAFSPPPKPQEQQAEQTAENVDSTWQRAKRQVFSPGAPRSPGGSDSAEEYNSQMVEELKRDLITTLKHAANIRGVQADEWIILTVIGGGRQSGGVFTGRGFMMGGMGGMYGGTSSGGMGGFGGSYSSSGGSSGYGSGGMGGMGGGMMGGGMGGGMGGMGGPGGTGLSPATVLTIRAKKSDIDAYAKGEQILVQFEQKVQIFIY